MDNSNGQQTDQFSSQNVNLQTENNSATDCSILDSKRIYQIQEQSENNVPQKIKFILMNWKIIPKFIIDANNLDLQIQINFAESQFKVEGVDQTKASDFFMNMKKTLAGKVIVYYKCNSDVEARSISSILQKGQIYTNLQETLNSLQKGQKYTNLQEAQNSQIIIVDQTTQFSLDLENDRECMNQLKYNSIYDLIQKQPIVFAIINNHQHQNTIENLQAKFTKFIQDSNNVIKLTDNQSFQLSNLHRLAEIQNKIESLNIQGCEIDISEPNMDHQTKKYLIKVTSTLWFSGIMSLASGKKTLNLMKDQIYDIFNPLISIYIQNLQKIEIWQDYLHTEYEKNSKEISIKTARNVNLNEIKIQLIGEYDECLIMQSQIQKELNEITSIVIVLQYKSNILTLNRVVNNISMKFRKQLDLIQQQHADLRIRINTVNTLKQEIGFKISYKNNLSYEYIKQLLLKDFVQEIQLWILKVDFDKFLQYLKLDIDSFDQTYATICQVQGDQVIFLSTEQCLIQVKKLVEQFNQYEQKLNQKLIHKTLDLSQEEVNFFIKKIKPYKFDDYLRRFQCEIEINQGNTSLGDCIVSTLQFSGRQLNVMYADISKIECDAIVNNCNNLMSLGDIAMLTRVAKKILGRIGADYTKFCESYIKENKTLVFGKAITYQLPNSNDRLLKYIINVTTPIYHNGEQTKQDLLIIEKNIEAIFIEANKNNIETLALPILGGGACGFSFIQIAQTSLNCIINSLYSQQNQSVSIVYVTELMEQKLIKICQILKEILQPPQQIRQIKYQWQCELNNKFQDYEDDEINKQIDEGYESFEKSKKNLELKLVFPITKKPGTHSVDLTKMIIKDKDLHIENKITQNTTNKFLFDNQLIDNVLNEYLMIQIMSNNLQFEIFYKKHKIVFNSNGEIHQFNETTGNKRKVNKIPYKQQIVQTHQNILIGKNIELKQNNTRNQKIQYEILVSSFDSKVIDNLQKTIKEDIQKNITDFSFSIPLIKQDVFNNLKQFLIQNSINYYGEIGNGAKVTLQIFKEEEQKIQDYIDMILDKATKYPKNWIPQDKNFIKVVLPNDSLEYKEIESEFKKTGNGTISEITRLQNQRLWENYQSELQILIDISIQRNTPLTQIEQERYLWHGVKKQHPKIIYESIKEAFDMTYSNQGMWGNGIYFAERASYSKDYSYTLTQKDDPTNANKLVFLCCKVATGKIHTCNSDKDIKRPPAGYDCVSGITGGSNVFVLYGMDVRRAYPAYEIIYQ